MKFAGMTSLEDTPTIRQIPPESKDWDSKNKRDWIHSEAAAFLNEVFQKSEIPDCFVQLDELTKRGFACQHKGCNITFPLHSTSVRHEITNHALLINYGGDSDRDSLGYYKCQFRECGFVFTTNATRNSRSSKT